MAVRIYLTTLAICLSFNLVMSETLHMDGSASNDSNDNIPDGRIVGGKEAKLGQFPYQALLSMTTEDGANANCGAALISDKYLVTAAHCSGFDSIKVTLGSIDSISMEGPKAVTLTVTKQHIYTHPHFDKWNLINDIAILELPQRVKFSEYIKPAALPKMNQSAPDTFVGKDAVISGWGLTEKDIYALQVILRFAYVNISEHEPCLEYYELFNINDGTICSEYHGTGTCNMYETEMQNPLFAKAEFTPDKNSNYLGRGGCMGDSGGPVALLNNKTHAFTLIGLTSFGTSNCTDKAPSVYTNVAYYLPWIHNVTKIKIN